MNINKRGKQQKKIHKKCDKNRFMSRKHKKNILWISWFPFTNRYHVIALCEKGFSLGGNVF